jgi:hypothetical protein
MTSFHVQVDVASVEVVLLDSSAGTETIPSLRLALGNLFIYLATETHASVPVFRAGALVAFDERTRLSLEVDAQLSSKYFNSNLDIEEALISVCLFGHRVKTFLGPHDRFRSQEIKHSKTSIAHVMHTHKRW